MARPEGLKREAQRADRDGVPGKGMFPPPQPARRLGERCVPRDRRLCIRVSRSIRLAFFTTAELLVIV